MATGRLVSADKVAGSAGMVLSVPWVVMGWGSTPSILAVVGGVMVYSGEGLSVLASGLRNGILQTT